MEKNINSHVQAKSLDITAGLPPAQEGKALNGKDLRAFALSLQGSSHKKSNAPCQDYSDIRMLEERDVILCGIADGLGSCKFSHWGAYIAVNAALGYVERQIGAFPVTEKQIRKILDKAFAYAVQAVQSEADKNGVAVYSMQSTLTVAVYNGDTLYCCHSGDDGVVIQSRSGNVQLATNRQKGEEANSVYPLQTCKWEIIKYTQVAGFVMATDGVLDAFVKPSGAAALESYFNGVYYPFMKNALYCMRDRSAGAALDFYKKYMDGDEYQKQVTDDLTLAAVISKKALADSVEPRFDRERWNSVERKNAEKRRAAFDRGSVPKNPGVQKSAIQVPTYETNNKYEPHGTNTYQKTKMEAEEGMNGGFLENKGISVIIAVFCLLIGFFGGKFYQDFSSRGKQETGIEDGRGADDTGGFTKGAQGDINAIDLRIDELETNYEALREQYEELQQNYEDLKEKYDELEEKASNEEQWRMDNKEAFSKFGIKMENQSDSKGDNSGPDGTDPETTDPSTVH